MCVLQYRVVYVDEDKNLQETIITVEKDTFEAAMLKYLETLSEVSPSIIGSRLLQIENNENANTTDLAQQTTQLKNS